MKSKLFAGIRSLFFVLASSSAQPQDDDLRCANDEEQAVLELLLDSQPEDTGWKLVCRDDGSDDNQVLWDTPAGSLLPDAASSWVTMSACVSTETTCMFTVLDATGDGLASDGWYSLLYGATTVAVYEYGKSKPFSADSFCFGPACDELPLERAEEVAAGGSTGKSSSSSSSSNKNESQSDDSGTNKAAIIGGVIGGLLLVILVIAAVVVIKKREERAFAFWQMSERSVVVIVEKQTAETSSDTDDNDEKQVTHDLEEMEI